MPHRQRSLITVALLAWSLPTCASPSDARPLDVRPVLDAERDQLITLFSADDVDEDIYRFGVSDAVPLPDGTVAISYDLAAESAGDETPLRPRLAILGDGGAVDPIELPELAGAAVDPGASLLAAAPDGTIYLWDPHPDRVVARDPDGDWRVLPVELVVSRYAPLAAVSADGSIYLGDDNGVHRVDPDGTATRIVRVSTAHSSNSWVPTVPIDQLPVPATSLILPALAGLAVDGTGRVYVSTKADVLVIDADGMLSLVAVSTELLAEVGASQPEGYPGPSALGIDADGSLLASYFYLQLVVKLAASGPTVLLGNAVLAGNGSNASFSPGGDLLVRVLVPDAHLAGEDQPDQLAAYGR